MSKGTKALMFLTAVSGLVAGLVVGRPEFFAVVGGGIMAGVLALTWWQDKRRRRRPPWGGALALVLVLALVPTTAGAAEPLKVFLPQVEIFRHVVDEGDFLVLARVHAVPQTANTFKDSFTVNVTSEAFDDPVVLVNKVHLTGEDAVDFTVQADGATDITESCKDGLGLDRRTLTCAATGLGDGSHSIEVAYRSGWLAYTSQDVFLRLLNGSTIVAEVAMPSTGFTMGGIYLTAAEVTAAGIEWEGADVKVEVTGSPAQWASPSAVVENAPTFNNSADVAGTKPVLTSRLRNMLQALEFAEVGGGSTTVGVGTYVVPLGITDAGQLVAARAFAVIALVIPDAFLSSVSLGTAGFTGGTTSLADDVDAAAAATGVAQSWNNVHSWTGRFVTLLVAFLAGGWVMVSLKEWRLALGIAWTITLLAWLLGLYPAAWVFLSGALLATGLFWMINSRTFEGSSAAAVASFSALWLAFALIGGLMDGQFLRGYGGAGDPDQVGTDAEVLQDIAQFEVAKSEQGFFGLVAQWVSAPVRYLKAWGRALTFDFQMFAGDYQWMRWALLMVFSAPLAWEMITRVLGR